MRISRRIYLSAPGWLPVVVCRGGVEKAQGFDPSLTKVVYETRYHGDGRETEEFVIGYFPGPVFFSGLRNPVGEVSAWPRQAAHAEA
jgi:hypothetical protein